MVTPGCGTLSLVVGEVTADPIASGLKSLTTSFDVTWLNSGVSASYIWACCSSCASVLLDGMSPGSPDGTMSRATIAKSCALDGTAAAAVAGMAAATSDPML